MNLPKFALSILFCLLFVGAFAETVKDREGSIRDDRAKMSGSTRWIYNDVDKGFAVAKQTGKPLMVVIRCVPCLACMGIDTQVLLENDELTPLMDQFVRVRVINANALDLSLFQFDYDLSFSTLFFNADGTVYGRYGSWAHQKDPEYKATASFGRAMEAALEIHSNYPSNRFSLAGKQGKPARYKTAIDMPGLKGKYHLDLNWEGKVVKSCVHCHEIGDAQRLSYRNHNRPIPEMLIYPFPAPRVIGVELFGDDIAKIKAVLKHSPASAAGLKANDHIIALDGQPLISTADLSWAFHHAPDSGQIPVLLKRGGADPNNRS